MFVVQLDAEHGAGKDGMNASFDFNVIFFLHALAAAFTGAAARCGAWSISVCHVGA